MPTTIATLGLLQDSKGQNTYLLNPTPYKYEALLVADTPKSVTAPLVNGPDAAWGMIIQRLDGNAVYAAINGTATAPSSTEFTLTDSYQNVPGFGINAGDVISLMTTDATARVVVLFYSGVS